MESNPRPSTWGIRRFDPITPSQYRLPIHHVRVISSYKVTLLQHCPFGDFTGDHLCGNSYQTSTHDINIYAEEKGSAWKKYATLLLTKNQENMIH